MENNSETVDVYLLKKENFKIEFFGEHGSKLTHIPSGAVAESNETCIKHTNTQMAFEKVTETEKFKAWQEMKRGEFKGKGQGG